MSIINPTSIPFEFCAIRFLIMWESQEKRLNAVMSKNADIKDLRAALAYFKVARNFKGLGLDETAKKILNLVQNARQSKNIPSERRVVDLAESFLANGFQMNLSAASKLLWLSDQSPYVIYDSRTVSSLSKMELLSRGSGYAEFCLAWKKAYRKCLPEIRRALNGLPNELPSARKFIPRLEISNEAIQLMVKKPWFRERVFDVYLWEMSDYI